MGEWRRSLRHVVDVRGWREVLRVRDVTLQEWALGSFHAALLLVGALLALHLADTLAGSLETGGTLLGGVLYLVLLSSTVLTARLVVEPSGLAERRDGRGTLRTVGWGVVGGGVNAVLFLLGLAVVVFAGLLLTSPGSVFLVVFLLAFGFLVALVAGVVLGTVFGLVDLLLFRLALRLVPDDGGGERL